MSGVNSERTVEEREQPHVRSELRENSRREQPHVRSELRENSRRKRAATCQE